jgi:hypothetical protein
MASFTDLLKKQKESKDNKTSNNDSDASVTNTVKESKKLDTISKNTQTTAQNSIVLSSMAKDMFLVKENLIKLVKLQGGTPRTRSVDWLSRQTARESALESERTASKSPTSVMSKESKKDKGVFSSMMGFLTPLLGFLTGFLGKGILTKLLAGGLILGILKLIGEGVRKFFTDEEFRKKVLDSIGKAFTESWKFLTETESGKNLLTGIATVTGALFGLKLAIKVISGVILGAARRMSSTLGLGLIPGTKSPKGGPRKNRGGKFGLLATIAAGLGLGLYALKDDVPEIDSGEQPIEKDDLSIGQTATGAAAAVLGFDAIRRLKSKSTNEISVDKRGRTFAFDTKTGRRVSVPKTKWSRFLTYLEKKSPKLFKIVGKRLLSLGAGFLVPGPGWIWSLIVLLGNVSLAWEVYNLWKEFSNKDDDSGESQSTSPTQEIETEQNDTGPTSIASSMEPNKNEQELLQQSKNKQILKLVDDFQAGKLTKDQYNSEIAKVSRVTEHKISQLKSTSPTSMGGVSLLNKLMDRESITDPDVRNRLLSLAQVESSMNPNARGPVIQTGMHRGDRAYGLLQIMPKTAAELGFSKQDLEDPEKAALAGLRYFKKNYENLGTLDAATIAHHAGPKKGKEFLRTGTVSTQDVATGLKTMDYLSKVSGVPKVSGSTLASASIMASDGKLEMMNGQSVVVNAPTTNVSQGSQTPMFSGKSASVIDNEFMKMLVGRTI